VNIVISGIGARIARIKRIEIRIQILRDVKPDKASAVVLAHSHSEGAGRNCDDVELPKVGGDGVGDLIAGINVREDIAAVRAREARVATAAAVRQASPVSTAAIRARRSINNGNDVAAAAVSVDTDIPGEIGRVRDREAHVFVEADISIIVLKAGRVFFGSNVEVAIPVTGVIHLNLKII